MTVFFRNLQNIFAYIHNWVISSYMMGMINTICTVPVIDKEFGTSPAIPHIQLFYNGQIFSFVICIVVETVNKVNNYVGQVKHDS